VAPDLGRGADVRERARPLLIGVALGNLLHGVPIGPDQEYAGDLVDLLNPYSLLIGVTVVLLCVLHGATFLALKTTGEVRERAVHAARRVAPVTVAAVVGFAVWTVVLVGKGVVSALPAVAAVLAVVAAWLLGRDREGLVRMDWNGLAFVATSLAIAMVVTSIFVGLYPRVMVSTLGSATDLTVSNTTSSHTRCG
jgi:cytochrome bd ubiquinol oxidase subunit II